MPKNIKNPHFLTFFANEAHFLIVPVLILHNKMVVLNLNIAIFLTLFGPFSSPLHILNNFGRELHLLLSIPLIESPLLFFKTKPYMNDYMALLLPMISFVFLVVFALFFSNLMNAPNLNPVLVYVVFWAME